MRCPASMPDGHGRDATVSLAIIVRPVLSLDHDFVTVSRAALSRSSSRFQPHAECGMWLQLKSSGFVYHLPIKTQLSSGNYWLSEFRYASRDVIENEISIIFLRILFAQ